MNCPKCGSTNIGQYRMMSGPIWCVDCSYRVEDKEKDKSFYPEKEEKFDVELKCPKCNTDMKEWVFKFTCRSNTCDYVYEKRRTIKDIGRR